MKRIFQFESLLSRLYLQPGSECAEQRELRDRYYAAFRAYSEMVSALEISGEKEFEEAYARADGVRLLYTRARLDLENHIREHECIVPAITAAAGIPE